jgi:hypothetical protein
VNHVGFLAEQESGCLPRPTLPGFDQILQEINSVYLVVEGDPSVLPFQGGEDTATVGSENYYVEITEKLRDVKVCNCPDLLACFGSSLRTRYNR